MRVFLVKTIYPLSDYLPFIACQIATQQLIFRRVNLSPYYFIIQGDGYLFMINVSSAQTDCRLAWAKSVSGGRQKAIFAMFSTTVFRPTNGPEHSGQSWVRSEHSSFKVNWAYLNYLDNRQLIAGSTDDVSIL